MRVRSGLRRREFRLLALLIAVVVGATGCTHKAARPARGAPSASSTLTTIGPYPTVSGNLGDKPTLVFQNGVTPSPKLQRNVLRMGSGPKLVSGDLIIADYLGQIWGGKVFDSSYDRGEASAFQIGVGGLIRGWDAGLVGVQVGSRIELTVPPVDGYGNIGKAAAGISGTDTLVFVIDIGRRYNNHSSADPSATLEPLPADLPTVTGALNAAPTITVSRSLPIPSMRRTYVLARGHGPALHQGTATIRYASVNWDGKSTGSTWDSGTTTAVPIGNAVDATGALFDGLVGVPAGSRVLVIAPAAPGAKQRANTAAVVVDVLDQVTTAKQMAAAS